jgi:hypothetical protein
MPVGCNSGISASAAACDVDSPTSASLEFGQSPDLDLDEILRDPQLVPIDSGLDIAGLHESSYNGSFRRGRWRPQETAS